MSEVLRTFQNLIISCVSGTTGENWHFMDRVTSIDQVDPTDEKCYCRKINLSIGSIRSVRSVRRVVKEGVQHRKISKISDPAEYPQ